MEKNAVKRCEAWNFSTLHLEKICCYGDPCKAQSIGVLG